MAEIADISILALLTSSDVWVWRADVGLRARDWEVGGFGDGGAKQLGDAIGAAVFAEYCALEFHGNFDATDDEDNFYGSANLGSMSLPKREGAPDEAVGPCR